MEGYTSYIELEAKWNTQGYLNFESNKPGAHHLFLTDKDDLHMYCGTNLVHMSKDTIDGNLDVGACASSSKIKNHILMILATLAICKWKREIKPTAFYTLKLITNMVKCFSLLEILTL